MQYLIQDIYPIATINILGQEFELGLITLKIQSYFFHKYGELENIDVIIKRNPMVIFDITWLLLKDKHIFNNDKQVFINKLYSLGMTAEITSELKFKIFDIVRLSMPKIANSKKYADLMKLNSLSEEALVCYGVYYDRLAKRYRYSLDDFMNLTLGQLYILLNVSSDQNYKDIELQASLQGRKLKAQTKFNDIDEATDNKLDEDAQDLLKRLQAEYKKNKG